MFGSKSSRRSQRDASFSRGGAAFDQRAEKSLSWRHLMMLRVAEKEMEATIVDWIDRASLPPAASSAQSSSAAADAFSAFSVLACSAASQLDYMS